MPLAIQPGDAFRKTEIPNVVWVVDRFKGQTRPVHAVLTKLDDPTVCITISIDALKDRRRFQPAPVS